MDTFSFDHPQILLAALAVLPLLALASVGSRAENSLKGRLTSLALRLMWAAGCITAAAGPVFSRTKVKPVHARIYVLQDASRSVADVAEQSARIRRDLGNALCADKDSAQGPEVVDVNFAGRPWRPGDPAAETSQTDIAAALQHVNLLSLDAPLVKVVVITDGRSTRGDPVEAAGRLALRGANVYAIPIGRRRSQAPHVVRADPPADAHVGIAATARVAVVSERPVRARVRLVDSSGNAVDERALPLAGEQTIVLHFTPKKGGVEIYSIRLDLLPEAGNEGETIADTKPLSVYVKSPARLLICDNFTEEVRALAKALEPLHVPIDTRSPDDWPSDLSGYAAIVISDWSGKELTADQRNALRAYVETQGGGLVFIGGGNVLPARWRDNPLAKMLPVTLEDKPAQLVKTRTTNSIVYVVDRSGSMNEALGGGATRVSKMDMVKAAIIASVQSLPEKTQVAVVSFNVLPEVLVPPTDVAEKDEISRRVDTLRAGGGTVIESAIRQGMALLATMPGKKHLILLTDGIDNHHPASEIDFWGAVADDAKKMGISWTSIAVGADADQALLGFLAQRTRGKFFFCDTADKIPQVFIQQAQSLQRLQQQRERSFQPRAGPAADHLKDIAPAEMPELDGHVRAKARDQTDVVLLGENDEPLLASWQFGLGRVVAFTSDAKNGWARSWIAWKGFSPFWLQTVQQVMRVIPDLNARVRGHVIGNQAIYNVRVTDQQGQSVDNLKTSGTIAPAPGLALATAPTTQPTLQWQQIAPGEYQASTELPADGQNYLISMTLEQETSQKTNRVRYCAVAAGQIDPEMAETGPNLAALNAIAEAGQGLCTTDVGQIAEACRTEMQTRIVERHPLWRALLIAALLLWPLDVLVRKVS